MTTVCTLSTAAEEKSQRGRAERQGREAGQRGRAERQGNHVFIHDSSFVFPALILFINIDIVD